MVQQESASNDKNVGYHEKNLMYLPTRPTILHANLAGINNLDRFFVCLHEIKHIIDQRIKPSCLAEFRCDKFALDFCNKLGWTSEMVKARMRWHVLSRVAMATNRKLKLVPSEIECYYNDIDFDRWYGRKVYVGVSRTETRRNPLWWDTIITIN